ncbi:MAG: hypothetical protein PHR06_13610, partial [Candidatus Cloacimonetes bacterium]|nr:hypothetical protein [Candidatus Cloacimonadota bacterium]
LIPFIQTDAESRFDLSGEVAVTIPSIKGHPDQSDVKEAYLEDMESILDAYPLGTSFTVWTPSSKPERNAPARRGLMYWYNKEYPNNKIYDPVNLTDDQKKENTSILKMNLDPPPISIPGMNQEYWTGVMRYLGNQIDWSQKNYIELYVSVENNRNVTMHIDFGDISEDFYEPGQSSIPDTEDNVNKDGILDANEEDTGLDGIYGRDGDNIFGDDGDDDFVKESNGDYSKINRMEGNARLDTEDLDGDGQLDQLNSYLQYSINLNSDISPYIESIYEYNEPLLDLKWKLIRIPISDFENVTDTNNKIPNLQDIRYARVWFVAEEPSTVINIEKMEVVGSKWKEMTIKDENNQDVNQSSLVYNQESIRFNVANNRTSDYVEPPGTYTTEDGVHSMEQSLMMECNNIQSGHRAMVRQRFNDAISLLGYNKLRFWVYQERLPDQIAPINPLEMVIRLGADSLTYYEINYKLDLDKIGTIESQMSRNNWQPVEVEFSDITILKDVAFSDTTFYIKDDRFTFRKIKSGQVDPTLSNIKEIALGIYNPGLNGQAAYTGKIYFNDIRVAEPYEEMGIAARTTLDLQFADFSTFRAEIEWKTDNFNTSYKRGSNYVNPTETVSLSLANNYKLNKFFPATWGLDIPLNLARNYSTGITRFKAASDILRKNLSASDKEREKDISKTYTASTKFNQTKKSENFILANTFGNLTLDAKVSYSEILKATSADTTFSQNYSASYNLDFKPDNIDIKLWKDYAFFFFPKKFTNSVAFKYDQPKKWKWETNSIDPGWTPYSGTGDTKTITTNNGINYDILSDLTASYSLNTKRDLMQKYYWKNYNIGAETERTQKFDFGYRPNYLSKIFSHNYSFTINYSEQQKKTSYTSESEYKFSGSSSVAFSANYTFRNRDMLSGIAEKMGIKTSDFKNKSLDMDVEDVFEEEKDDEDLGAIEEDMFDDSFSYSDNEHSEILPDDENDDNIEKEKEAEDENSENIDSKEKEEFNFLKTLFEYFARLDNVTFSYSNSRNSTFADELERPDFMYQLGFDTLENPTMKKLSYSYKIKSGLAITENLSTSFGFDYRLDKSNSRSSDASYTEDVIFPSITASLTNFHELIKASSFMSSSSLRSGYSKSRKLEGRSLDSPNSITTTNNFSPLIQWDGRLFDKLSSKFSVNYRAVNRTSGSSATQKTEENNTNMSISNDYSYSFSAEKGWKLPLTNYVIQFKNEMSTNLTFKYETKKTVQKGQETNTTQDKISYSVVPGLSYNFHKNVKGGTNVRYTYDNDIKQDRKTSDFSLEIWVEIIF